MEIQESTPLGETAVNGGKDEIPVFYDNDGFLPFRDGVHIKNDMKQLKLPAFAICEDVVKELSPEWKR